MFGFSFSAISDHLLSERYRWSGLQGIRTKAYILREAYIPNTWSVRFFEGVVPELLPGNGRNFVSGRSYQRLPDNRGLSPQNPTLPFADPHPGKCLSH